MSYQEIDRVGVVELVESKRLSQLEGSKQLNISSRQMRRLQQRYRKEGVTGLISKRRGQPSNNQLSEAIKSEISSLVREKYSDFGPTLAHEKLVEQHNLKLSIESLRQLMIADDLWVPKQRKTKRVFQLRPRRERFGELIQIDGSPHDWFEGRSESCTLIVFIDDATSKLTGLQFFPTETTQAYMHVLKSHMASYGRPVSFYSDRHGIFRVNQKETKSGDGHTQFSRALETLDIESIQAQTPQAKGRVERVNKTLQDRLVKEMRLKGINNRDEANAFLPEFIVAFNQRFEKQEKNKEDAHRKVLHTPREIDLILSRHSKRKVSNELEISYEKTIYQIQGNRHRLKQKEVTVCDLFGQEVVLLYEGKEIAYKLFNESGPSPKLEDEKTLNKRVDQAIERQSKTAYKPAADHPWRRCAGPLTKHDFPSERVDKSLISVDTDTNNLTTLNHTLPTAQRAKQGASIKTPAGQ
jgi:transposase